ncbi:MAG TPA: nucleoside deaminase [Opitutaceae bacterium]|jgi:tRNA(Arg) A34 adenosine deaminase TadA
MSHDDHMRDAIRLSEEGLRSGKGGPFGCVVVRAGKVVGRGNNQVTSACDPTAHAEVVAIRDACRALGTYHLEDCVVYTSCEPCPMCLSAIYWARIPTVYYGNSRSDAAAVGFDDEFIYREVALPVGGRKVAMRALLAAEAKRAFAEWGAKADKVPY